MASLLQSERVLYLVRGEKEMRAPLSQLYFCRYCSELRSLECVSHEVTAARPRRHTARGAALRALIGCFACRLLATCLVIGWRRPLGVGTAVLLVNDAIGCP